MGILNYTRHFGLLTCLAVLLAATRPWVPAIGVAAAFGIYGALHAGSLAVTLRAQRSPGLRLGFVAIGALLSMASVALGMCLSRFMGGPMGIARTVLVLSLSSGLGAASYANLIRRFFGAHLTRPAIAAIALGCVVATVTVVVSGNQLKAGGLWVVESWWFAMSLGLWFCDGRAARRLPRIARDGTIGPIGETERGDTER